jgi:hypothetical protein
MVFKMCSTTLCFQKAQTTQTYLLTITFNNKQERHWLWFQSIQFVGFEVLTAVIMNAAIFWDIAPCSPYVNRRFRRTYHLHLQGLAICCTLVPCSADFRSWRWRWHVSPKRCLTYWLHGATSQKMATSNTVWFDFHFERYKRFLSFSCQCLSPYKLLVRYVDKRRSLGRYSSLADSGHGLASLQQISYYTKASSVVSLLKPSHGT